MNQLPFKLLTQNKTVRFNPLSTELGKSVYSHSKRYQEAWNTEFLNAMQDNATFYDSRFWSQQERHVAMLIIYLDVFRDIPDKIQEEFAMNKCSICGDSHPVVVDYREFLNPDRKFGGIKTLSKLPEINAQCEKYTVHPLDGEYLMEVEKLQRQYPPGCLEMLLEANNQAFVQFSDFLESDRYASLKEEESILTICNYLRKKHSEFNDYFAFKNLWELIKTVLPELDHGINWTIQFKCPKEFNKIKRHYPEGAYDAMLELKAKGKVRTGFDQFFESDEYSALKKAEASLEVTLPIPFRKLIKLQNMGY